MRTSTLTWAQWRTRCAGRGHARTWALKDRLAALGHYRPRRRAGNRTHRCGVHRTRSSLRHDEPAHWGSRLRRGRGPRRSGRYSCAFLDLSGTAWPCGRHNNMRSRCRQSCGLRRLRLRGCLYFRQRRSFGLGFIQNGGSAFDGSLGYLRLGCLGCLRPRWRWWRRRPGRRNDGRRRTRHRLRGDEAGRGLRLSRERSGAGCRSGLRRHSRWRRSHRTGGRRSGARRRRRWRSPLGDRLQHIAGFRDVRQIDPGLELVRQRGRRTRPTRRGGGLLGKILFDALSLVFLNRAGVRFLLSDADLGQNLEDFSALDLEFSRQIVDSNFVLLHYAPFPPLCPVWLRLHSILTVMVDVRVEPPFRPASQPRIYDRERASCSLTTASYERFSPGCSSSGTFSFSVAGRS